MKKITLLLGCLMCFSVVVTSQVQQAGQVKSVELSEYPAAYYNAKSKAISETFKQQPSKSNVSFNFQTEIPNTGKIYQSKPGATNVLIYDNGPHFNIPGNPDYSRLENTSLGMDSYGFNSHFGDYHVADEFSLVEDTEITSIDVYAYQTGGPSNSINGVYLQIWDGDPSSGTASVIWGDRITNLFGGVVWSNAYRDLESTPGDTSREIQLVTANTSNLVLNSGTYWVEYGFSGIGASGPWAPPISILGATNTGNGLQYDIALNTWSPLIDSGTNMGQGLPFQIYGDPLAFPGAYCGPLEFPNDVEPITLVKIADIDNVSSEILNASPEHEDFTHISSLVEEGQSYIVTLEGNTNGNNTNRFVVFVDWNQNGVLDDAGEVYEITDLLNNSTGIDGKQVSGSIVIPMGAKPGETRMRVKKISGTTDFLDPCLGADLGQSEDYSLEVVRAGYFPPGNDFCVDAFTINCGDSVMGKTKNATANFDTPVCGTVSVTTPGVWYVFDDNSGVNADITISLCNTNTAFDTKLSVFTGDCSGLVCLIADDDGCGEQSEVTFLSDGNTQYYIHVHGYDGQVGDFELELECVPILGTSDNSIKGFSFYPNPSSEVVSLSSVGNIENVTVYNMLGQRVVEYDINSSEFDMDVSGLAIGAYVMKVTVDGQIANYRINKK